MVTTTDATPTTTRGTPCARSWTHDWITRVESREEELGRRICGARTVGHSPCPALSAHPSGRCEHHGGFDLTGAPEGNRNAIVHNLYARRLMPCGSHCPSWQSCPLGGGARDGGKEMLSRAPVDRPACPFEQAEYTAAVTDAMRRTQNHHANAWGLHVAHQVALMTVLVGRAARALATHPFTQTVENYQGEHLVLSERPAAALIAYERLARELRRWTILLERCYEWISCDDDTSKHHAQRQTTDTSTDPDALAATATADPSSIGLRPMKETPASPIHTANTHRPEPAATVPADIRGAGQPAMTASADIRGAGFQPAKASPEPSRSSDSSDLSDSSDGPRSAGVPPANADPDFNSDLSDSSDGPRSAGVPPANADPDFSSDLSDSSDGPRSAGVPPANADPDFSTETPSPTGDPALQATRDRINGLIHSVAPWLVEPLSVHSPPDSTSHIPRPP